MVYLTGKKCTINVFTNGEDYTSYGSYGIFGNINSATIKNINVTGSAKMTAINSGTIVGYMTNSTVQDCKSYVYVNNGGQDFIGGIVR